MTQNPVIEVIYDVDDSGDAVFRVTRRSRAAADNYFVYDKVYRMEEVDEAQKAHDRFFHARLRELFDTLPETDDERFTSVDNFRGWALIRCGYARTSYMPCGSEENAEKNAAFLLTVMRSQGFAIVQAQGDVVAVTKPFSQKLRSDDMDKDMRKRSYADVLEFTEDFVKAAHERQAQKRLEAPRRLLTHDTD